MGFEFEDERLATGVDALDRELQGGLPAGSLVAYCAPPASQSELLLYELTSTRPALYLTGDRTAEAVGDALGRAECPTGDPEIRRIPLDAPIQHATELVGQLGEGTNLIVDPADTLERTDRSRYANFLNDLQTHMVNTGGVAVLHCLAGNDAPELRATTKHVADVVLDLYQSYEGVEVETRLAVPKFRGGEALTETIKLELSGRVRVDTSRDIA